MRPKHCVQWIACVFTFVACLPAVANDKTPAENAAAATASSAVEPGVVRVANLTYGTKKKSSVCFSDKFLTQIERETNVKAERKFHAVDAESGELFEHPFAVMTGEGAFTLSQAQRDNLRDYLSCGGFVIASAGCSSKPWNKSFAKEIALMFPDATLEPLPAEHPIFHTVYDVTESRYKSGKSALPVLKGLTIEGRTALIWSPDGLNDTANAGPDCCCCGGNEVKSARLLNVNILAYALTH